MAANTIKSYKRELSVMDRFFQKKSKSLLTAVYDDFLAWRESLKRAPGGINICLCAARAFFSFCESRGIIRPNPFPTCFKIKVKTQEPTAVPTVAEFLAMRDKLEGEIEGSRLDKITRQAIVETLAGSGLRIEALLTLKAKHLHLENGRPHILVDSDMSCKGKAAGTVPLSPYCAEVLRKYLVEHHPAAKDNVFPVTAATVRALLVKITPASLGVVPHSLRHFYCSMTYFKNFDGGKNDIVWVCEAAAHSNINTTHIYCKMAKRVCQTEQEWELWAKGKSA